MLRPVEEENNKENKDNSPLRDGAGEAFPVILQEEDAAPAVKAGFRFKKAKKQGKIVPLGEQQGSLVMPCKKTRWLIFLTGIYNGIMLSAMILLTAALLTFSYLQESHPLLAWFAFIPFCLGIFHIKRSFMAFLFGIVTGVFTYMGILYWIGPTVFFGTANAGLANASVLGLSALLSLQFGIFACLCFYLKRVTWLLPLSGACAWVSLEFLHQLIAYKFMAFPWFVLGYTQYSNTALIQISSYGGAYAVSFLIIFFAFAMAAAASSRGRAVTRAALFAAPFLVLGTVYFHGNKILAEQSAFLAYGRKKVSVALMQPYTHNLMMEGYEEDVIYTIYEQAAALETKKTELIIWPESSYPGSFEEPGYYDFLKNVSANNNNAYQVTGSYSLGPGGDYVSAALFNKEGLLDVYHKNKIVPFGEFLPFYGLFKKFYDAYGISSFTGNFIESKDPGKVFNISLLNGEEPEVFTFGTGICFESLFPSIWRAQARAGAQFFVNISNDGWFLDTAAPYQHLRINVFRAVENRRPLLRSTNTGISAWINALGEIKFFTELNKQETALLNFSFQPKSLKTFYTLHGDLFAWVCVILTVNFFIVCAAFLNISVYDRT